MAGSPAPVSSQTGHDVVDTTFIQLLGVGLFTVIAGFNDELGSVMVVIMWGLVIGWLLMHSNDLKNMVKNL